MGLLCPPLLLRVTVSSPFLSHIASVCLHSVVSCLFSLYLSLGGLSQSFFFVSILVSLFLCSPRLWVSVSLGLYLYIGPSSPSNPPQVSSGPLKGKRAPGSLTLSPQLPSPRVSVTRSNKPRALEEDLALWEPAGSPGAAE